MDILDEVVGTPQQDVTLEDLIVQPGQGLRVPKNAARNRAATTAFLSDPAKIVDNYSLMMHEQDQGQDIFGKQLRDGIVSRSTQLDMKGVMDVLADPSLSIEQKQQAIKSIKSSQFLKDQGNTLFTNALTKESVGETIEAEDARLSSIDAIREIYESRNIVQGLVNAHAASLKDGGAKTLAEMAELWILPFGNTVHAGRLKKAVNPNQPLWETIKGFLLPGSATASLNDRLASIPPEKRPEFAKALVKAISETGVVFSNDNQFAQYDKAQSIFEEGGYSGFQEFLDNVSPLLDVIGIGQVLRGFNKTSKVLKKVVEAEKTVPIVPTFGERLEKSILAESIGKIGAEDFKTNKPFTIDDLHTPTREPTPGGSVLLGGTGLKVPPTSKVPRLLQKETDAERLARIRRELSDELDRISLNSVVREEHPASIAAIMQQASPATARQLHRVIVTAESDQAAEALYATARQQAIVNDVFPQVDTGSGVVVSKVMDIQRDLRQELHIPAELIDLVHNTGATYYTRDEKAAARAHIVNRFSHAEGLTMNESMSSFTLDGGRVRISAVYGTPEGSFSDAVQAFSQAKTALRNEGVLDSEITVLRKEGINHVPLGLNDTVPDGPGNYLVRVDTFHDFDPTDFTRLETFDVKRNLFDRIGPTVSEHKGSVTRYLLDAASTVHPVYSGAAAVTSDATARFDKFMLKLAEEYSSQFNGFDKARKAKIEDYIKEANYNGIKFDRTDLLARGFSPEEIEALASWKKFWDAHFYLENYDVVRSLNSQGYQLFRNQTTELYAKPIAKNQNLGGLYDPASDSVIVHTKADGDALYQSGGTYAKLRRPANFNGAVAEYMIVRNTPTEYLRKFRESDRVLNYRDGYFQLQYTAPKFVDELQKDGKYKTVAVAGDTAEAKRFAERMKTSTGNEYRVRGDERALRRDDDAWWDLASASGRIAQRQRGKLLEDGSGLNHLGDNSYIINPVDSAIIAAKSIAGRTVTRPMLEAARARFMNQYERLLPSNGYGGVRYPNRVSEIGSKGEHTSKEIADARTVYEYINYLENGYLNTLDDVFKAGMNATANMLGNLGLSKAERAANIVGDGAPMSLAKNTVFTAYIGTNVLRQLIIQPHQIIRTWAYNPTGWLTGSIHKLMADWTGYKLGLNPNSGFGKFVEDSGFLDAVDKQNLVRGTLASAKDGRVGVVRNIANLPRKAGFDIGEQVNMLGHAAAVYDRYKRLGKDLADKAVRDEAFSEIRAISYDMNFAGDMVYNQTTPSIVLQFMQVPHKAFLQLTNRRIDPAVRAKLVAGDLIFWGPPTALISSTLGVDILPDNPELKEAFLWGVESWAINSALTLALGSKTEIDFSSLAPYDTTGWQKFFVTMYSGGLHDLFLNSPAGQLAFKDGSRFHTAVASMGRYFGIVEDDQEDPETFLSVMHEVAKISSGYSNGYKAKVLLDAQKRLDQYSSVIDKNVGHAEAWAQLFGFGTSDTRDLYRMSTEMSKDLKSHDEEVIRVYEDIKRYYTEKLEIENTDPKWITKVTGRLLKVYEDDPRALGIIRSKLEKDLTGKDKQLLDLFIRRSNIPSLGGMRDKIKQMPVTDEEKELMFKRLDDMEKAMKDVKETK